jgi:hypothetical protein
MHKNVCHKIFIRVIANISFPTELNVSYKEINYSNKFDGHRKQYKKLMKYEYQERLLEKINKRLENEQICDENCISVSFENTEDDNIEVVAVAIMILKDIEYSQNLEIAKNKNNNINDGDNEIRIRNKAVSTNSSDNANSYNNDRYSTDDRYSPDIPSHICSPAIDVVTVIKEQEEAIEYNRYNSIVDNITFLGETREGGESILLSHSPNPEGKSPDKDDLNPDLDVVNGSPYEADSDPDEVDTGVNQVNPGPDVDTASIGIPLQVH